MMLKPLRLLALLTAIALCACHRSSTANGGLYPAHWWIAIPAAQAADWEILPQEAGPGEVILSKRNELGLLSNFAPTPFTYKGKSYASVEGFWQSLKYPEDAQDPRATAGELIWEHTREQVEQLSSLQAKHAGDRASENMRKLGINWVTFEGKRIIYRTPQQGAHYRLIKDVMWHKVLQNDNVREVLMKTGKLVLRPDHKTRPDDPPAWRYYDIWMDIREELLQQ